MKYMRRALLLLWGGFILLNGCSPSPEPISYGTDSCDYCKMTIVDAKFSSELVTRKGKVYKFDSIECMAGFTIENKMTAEKVHSLWVMPIESPQQFMNVDQAVFLHSEAIRSPMRMGLAAFPDLQAAQKVQADYQGEILTWEEVIQLVEKQWLDKSKH